MPSDESLDAGCQGDTACIVGTRSRLPLVMLATITTVALDGLAVTAAFASRRYRPIRQQKSRARITTRMTSVIAIRLRNWSKRRWSTTTTTMERLNVSRGNSMNAYEFYECLLFAIQKHKHLDIFAQTVPGKINWMK